MPACMNCMCEKSPYFTTSVTTAPLPPVTTTFLPPVTTTSLPPVTTAFLPPVTTTPLPPVTTTPLQQQQKAKYADLPTTHHFVPIGIETTDVFGPEALSFIKKLGHRLRASSGEPLIFSHLLQQIGVTIQRGNTAVYTWHCSCYTSCSYYYSFSSCPSSAYRECPSYYSSSYYTRCVAHSLYTRSSTPCSFYASYSNGRCPT